MVYVPGAAEVGAGEPESLPLGRPCGVDGVDGAIVMKPKIEDPESVDNPLQTSRPIYDATDARL